MIRDQYVVDGAHWLKNNAPDNAIIFTQPGITNFIRAETMRTAESGGVLLEDPPEIISFINNIPGNDYVIYIFISKSLQEWGKGQSNREFYDPLTLCRLDLNKFEDPHFTKVYENPSVVIFKFSSNVATVKENSY